MGLIIKDLLCLRRVLTSVLLVAAFYILLSFTAMFNLSIMAGVVTIMLSFMAANCFSYDKAAGWDVYAGTFPLSRARLVGARYLSILLLMVLGWLFSLAAAGLGSLLGLMDDWEVFLVTDVAYLLVALIFNAIVLPLLYKFGAERGRIIFYGVMAALFVLGWVLFTALGGEEFLEAMDKEDLSPAPVVATLVLSALALLGLSFPLSLRFYRKQEL